MQTTVPTSPLADPASQLQLRLAPRPVTAAPCNLDQPSSFNKLARTPPVRNEQALPARRILVVDDTRAVAYMLGRLLELLGQQVTRAHSGAEALEHLRSATTDMVFCDIAMPGMDGNELASLVRRDPQLEGLTLIALTGFGQEADRQKSIAAGFDKHLVKPVSIDELRALLRKPASAPPDVPARAAVRD